MRQLVFVQKMKGTRETPVPPPAEESPRKPLEIFFPGEGRSERLFSGEEIGIFRTSGSGYCYEKVEKYNAAGVRFEIEKPLFL